MTTWVKVEVSEGDVCGLEMYRCTGESSIAPMSYATWSASLLVDRSRHHSAAAATPVAHFPRPMYSFKSAVARLV